MTVPRDSRQAAKKEQLFETGWRNLYEEDPRGRELNPKSAHGNVIAEGKPCRRGALFCAVSSYVASGNKQPRAARVKEAQLFAHK